MLSLAHLTRFFVKRGPGHVLRQKKRLCELLEARPQKMASYSLIRKHLVRDNNIFITIIIIIVIII